MKRFGWVVIGFAAGLCAAYGPLGAFRAGEATPKQECTPAPAPQAPPPAPPAKAESRPTIFHADVRSGRSGDAECRARGGHCLSMIPSRLHEGGQPAYLACHSQLVREPGPQRFRATSVLVPGTRTGGWRGQAVVRLPTPGLIFDDDDENRATKAAICVAGLDPAPKLPTPVEF